MEYNFEVVVDRLLSERKRTKKSLYDHVGMTRQGFDTMLKNNTVSAVKLATIADFLDVPVSYFYGESGVSERTSTPGEGKTKYDVESIAEGIEVIKGYFETQLQAKDRQIEKLLDLLGKLEGAISQTAFADKGEFHQAGAEYVSSVLRDYIRPMLELTN